MGCLGNWSLELGLGQGLTLVTNFPFEEGLLWD